MRRFLILASLPLFALALAGCAGLSGGGDGFGMIAKDHIPFYLTGPAEPVPDRYLEYGTRMRAVTGGPEGYIRVQLVSGETGFVPASGVSEAPDPTTPQSSGR